MKRFAAQYLFVENDLKKKGFVEMNSDGEVLDVGVLAEGEEIHTTVFFNGILIPEVFAVDEQLPIGEKIQDAIVKRLTEQKKVIAVGNKVKLQCIEQIDWISFCFSDQSNCFSVKLSDYEN